MEQTLEVACRGSTSRFTTRKLSRSALYGRKRRVPVDDQGRECRAAALTRDGRFLLPPGSTATLYLDEHGDERVDLRREVIRFLVSSEGQEALLATESERRFHEALKERASADLAALLEAVLAYETLPNLGP